MNIIILLLIGAAVFGLAGCGKPADGSAPASAPTNLAAVLPVPNPMGATAAPPLTVAVATPVLQPILTAWQEGNHAAALKQFTAANWNGRPIFPAGMALALTEAQIRSLPEADRQLKTGELFRQVGLLKELANAVNEAGTQSASQNDPAQARQYLTALKQFGSALDDPKSAQVVRMVGTVSKNMARNGLAKLGS